RFGVTSVLDMRAAPNRSSHHVIGAVRRLPAQKRRPRTTREGGGMNSRRALSAAFVGLMSLWPLQTKGDAQTQQKPTVQIPQPGVPQIMTMEAKFVRASYNNEGYVILGYQATNRS